MTHLFCLDEGENGREYRRRMQEVKKRKRIEEVDGGIRKKRGKKRNKNEEVEGGIERKRKRMREKSKGE